MRARLFVLFIFFLLYSATSYINSTSFTRLKSQPFLWSDGNIEIVSIILTFMQCLSIFLGGFLAAFIIPLWILLVLLFSCVLIAVSIFGVAANGNDSEPLVRSFVSENYVFIVVIFFILFGIYTGISKFLFLVIILDQEESGSIEFAMGCYLFCINLSYSFVYLLLPSSMRRNEYYLYISLPLILVAIILLLIGRWKNLYCLDSKQVDIIAIIHKRIKSRIDRSLDFHIASEITNVESEPTETTENNCVMDSEENDSTKVILSFSRLCIIFITLLPYGICDSQLQSTYIIQSNYLLQPKIDYYAMKSGFWVVIINGCGVMIFLYLLAVLKNSNNFFKKLFSQFLPRIIASYLLMFLSILSAGILESFRLDIYWGSKFSTKPSQHSSNQIIENTTYSVADMSIFFMTPQLLFSSFSEIFLITTCGQFIYEQSVSSMKHLTISFFLGAVGLGGAGGLISLILTKVLNKKMFDPSDLNNRTFHNGTCCSFQSRLDAWFYCLASVFFLAIILSTILLSNFKHYYQKKCITNNSRGFN